MMFLDCPAYLDDEHAVRCGLPAEVRRWYTMRSTDGLLECAMIRCPSGHWFNGPIESLTWDRSPGRPAATSPTASTTERGSRPDARGATTVREPPAQPRQDVARPNTAPAYYQGRPARMWITAMTPRRTRQPAAGAQHPAGHEQLPNPAHQPSEARPAEALNS